MRRLVRFMTCCLTCVPVLAFGQDDSLDRDYGDELPRIPAKEPQDALDTFEIHQDFRIELVAAEPLVRDPIAMAFDEAGRMFVVEMRGYSEARDENVGAVRLLEDTDDDGVFDVSHPYVEGLAWPTAVACYDGGIFVGCAPDIWYFKDTDGDHRADEKRMVYSGFGLTNVQGLLNTFLWGVDNRLHGATSSSGAEAYRVDETAAPRVSLRGRDFSFDPKTLELAPESGGAQHGMTFDPFGRKFVCSNSDHLQLVTYEDRYLKGNPYYAGPAPRMSIAADGPSADVFRISPVEPWRIVRTRLRVKGLVPGPVEGGGTAAGYFTSATGVTVYKGDLFPREYYGNVFIGDVGGNLVHRKRIDANGAQFKGIRTEEKTEFLRSTDIWFRPVQFTNGPDGALYLADMYREVIEHPDSLPPIIKQHLDLNSGNNRGRIYRIVPKDARPSRFPSIAKEPDAGLVAVLEHPNAWHRETAARLLYERNATGSEIHLRARARIASLPESRTQILWVLQSLGLLTADDVLMALGDSDPRVRENALKLAEPLVRSNSGLVDAVVARVQDRDPRVRYQLAYTLGAIPAAERAHALAQLLGKDGDDRWTRNGILCSARESAPGVVAAIVREPILLKRETTQSLLSELARQAGAYGAPSDLDDMLTAIDALDAGKEPLLDGVLGGVQLARRGGEVADTLRAHPIVAERVESRAAGALAVLATDDATPEDLVRALADAQFAPFAETAPLLGPLLDSRRPPEVQLAALQTIQATGDPAGAPVVIAALPALGTQSREAALETLSSREPWLLALLESIAKGETPKTIANSVRRDVWQRHRSEDVRVAFAKAFASEERADRDAIVASYTDALSLDGDRVKGKTVFTENCSKCHRLEGVGFDVGPDLVTVATGGKEKILTNLLDPNREINPQYINYMVDTTEWETHTGVLAAETASSITLKRPSGESSTILRVNIESIRSTDLSIMPEGWEESLTKQDVADLLAYITSVGN